MDVYRGGLEGWVGGGGSQLEFWGWRGADVRGIKKACGDIYDVESFARAPSRRFSFWLTGVVFVCLSSLRCGVR